MFRQRQKSSEAIEAEKEALAMNPEERKIYEDQLARFDQGVSTATIDNRKKHLLRPVGNPT